MSEKVNLKKDVSSMVPWSKKIYRTYLLIRLFAKHYKDFVNAGVIFKAVSKQLAIEVCWH
ncbi:hypothetical protein ES708_06301 [subsurface metagenome]